MVAPLERYPLNLARGIVAADARFRVDLVTTGATAKVSSPQPRLVVHVLPVTLAGADPLDDLSSSLADVLEETDLVHIHHIGSRAGRLALLVAKLLGKPVVAGAPTLESAEHERLVDLFVLPSAFVAAQFPRVEARVTLPGGVDDRFMRPSVGDTRRQFV